MSMLLTLGIMVAFIFGARKFVDGRINALSALEPLEHRLQKLEADLAALSLRVGQATATGAQPADSPIGDPVATPAARPTAATEPSPRAAWAETRRPVVVPRASEPAGEQPATHEVLTARAISRPRVDDLEPVIRHDELRHAPSALQSTPSWMRWILGGNTLVRVGVVILFFGLAFLAKFAAEHVTVPIEMRLLGIAASGVGLLAFGWRLRATRPGYGLSLQGGGIGIFYLTIFAALRLYHLMPAVTAFALMLGIVVVAILLAVRQTSLALAMLGATGGFLAPILASTGQGSHVVLFSYYTILNIGILGVAWHRAWRPLNLLGFVFTFVIGAVWGVLDYSSTHFRTTEPFLVLFFAMYVGIALLYAARRALELKHYVDGTIVFGTPLAAFTLQAALVRDIDNALALSAVALAVLYVGLAQWLRSRQEPRLELLIDSFRAMALVFATLAVPLYFEASGTSAAWALEGAAIVWIAGRQGLRLAQWFGLALQPAAAAAFLLGLDDRPSVTVPLVNSTFLGAVLLAAGAIISSRQVARRSEVLGEAASAVVVLLFGSGFLCWGLAGVHEIHHFIPQYQHPALLAFFATTALSVMLAHRFIEWDLLLAPPALLLPVLYVIGAWQIVDGSHPFAAWSALAWPVAFAVLLRFLHLRENSLPDGVVAAMHAGMTWLAIFLVALEAHWQVTQRFAEPLVWQVVMVLSISAAALIALMHGAKGSAWPVGAHGRTHARLTAIPLLVLLWLVTLAAGLTSEGDAPPLRYLPFFNPLDLACALALVALTAWYRQAQRFGLSLPAVPMLTAFGALGFAWLNGVLLRTIHHWIGVPWSASLLDSQPVQTGFTVFWTALAVIAMLLATRRSTRVLWFTGAALLGIVVLKLFLFDLSQLAGLLRIVSFLGVGVLLLAIGYFSPLPPRQAALATE